MRKETEQNPPPTNGGQWWDKLGKPQYGGEMVIRVKNKIVNFDPYYGVQNTQIHSAWLEKLHTDDWTLDPAVFDYKMSFRPNQYVKGHLVKSWEFADPSTYVVHLREGIHWQDVPPANGREFTADDVVLHFNRLCGLGSGFTKPGPGHDDVAPFKELISVTAADKYTVVFKWNTSNRHLIIDAMQEVGTTLCMENPEAVRQWGDVSDWHHAVGTGPFILQDFVPDKSATMIRNPNYWGSDERYPQNKLPYVDKLKILIIPDDNAALEALRAGEVDIIDQISPEQAQAIRKTNSAILQMALPQTAYTLDPRNDKPPYSDIRVRKALQMAIDLPTIAGTYYHGNVEPYPATLTSRYLKGWGFPYEQWPQELKNEYAYNPAAAKKLLAEAGYPNGFKTHVVVDNKADLNVLQIVKSYFAAVGIDMEIRPMEGGDWFALVLKDRKYEQLAVCTMSPYGHGYKPVRQLSRLMTGQLYNYMMINDPVYDAFQPKVIAAGSENEQKQVIRDANEHVARQHYLISLAQPVKYALYQPWFKGYHGQFGSVNCSPAGNPEMLSFYAARFWIDRKLKKSMGH